ncbi:hydroxyisourate hydrolase [Mycolicibacterium sp. GCM10028919]|jgi:5-hydroxyisourate hydrolase|uniref:hydroxyisourate hydrolase n=1 Tax=Mycolicibacterium sp. GCM10028919 TaxID=3273401 RepID=UPI003620B793
MTISTHVLDAVAGTPAAGVAVTLLDADHTVLSEGNTDDDGRIARVAETLPTGVYRLRFDTGAYFARLGTPAFYPEVTVTFEIVDAAAHHHVPLLLSPYAYSTYRGS